MSKAPLGFQPKVRTLDEVNKDYNDNAIMAGHKARVIAELQDEVDTHVRNMRKINHEAKKIQTPDVTPPAGDASPELVQPTEPSESPEPQDAA